MNLLFSKPGYNATSGTLTPDQTTFDAQYDTLKYYKAGSVSLVYSGTAGGTTVAHNLGYYPFFTAYCQVDEFGNRYSMFPFTFADGLTYLYVNANAGTDNIYFDFTAGGSPVGTLTIYYKIFKNDIGL